MMTRIPPSAPGRQASIATTAPHGGAAQSADRPGGGRVSRRTVVLAVLLVLAVAVTAGVLLQEHQKSMIARAVLPAETVAGAVYPVALDQTGLVVTVGRPGAGTAIDIYEDFLCPVCGQFESEYFAGLERRLEAGRILVRYHFMDLLDPRSDPPGYSDRAANVALAVAATQPAKFMDFHYSLYRDQPVEGGAGWSQSQLLSLAARLGVAGDRFSSLAGSGAFVARIRTASAAAESDQALWQGSGTGRSFATPAVISAGRIIPWNTDANWLDELVAP